jgi:hypothetical protein
MIRAKTPKCANKACGQRFTPTERHPFAVACCTGCEIILSKIRLEKLRLSREAAAKRAGRAERKATKARLIELKPTKWHRANCKRAMHDLVRAEAEGEPCISCDTILLKLGRVGGDYDAGHFRSVGSAKHLEFDRRNVWGQCKHCNDHLKGNPQQYERRLRIRKGDPFVDALLADQAPRHYKSADYLAMTAKFVAELKLVVAERELSREAA